MIKVAAAQFAASTDKSANIKKIRLLAEASKEMGADVTCFPELCTTTYFCWESNPEHFKLAESITGESAAAIADIARSTQQIIVCGLYEKVGSTEYYNSCIIMDAQGELIGLYRKNSIPLSVGLAGITANEKMYFRPGNLGFPVFATPNCGHLGVMICYDRHFPEGARSLALGGAEIIFIPTASWRAQMSEVWEIELRAHAIANAYFVCGVNKVGKESGGSQENVYFGSSLLVDPSGQVLARASDDKEDVLVAEVDLNLVAEKRRMWPVFRDRRPDAYSALVK